MSSPTRENELFRDIAEAREWFGDSLFNLLMDYYTEIPMRPYGPGATPENVLPILEKLQLGMIIIYAKGHSGRTSFPSALHTEHIRLARNMPAAFREYTRETGTRLFLYYSGLLDGLAGLRNPDWRMLDRDGKPMSHFDEYILGYPICPLSPYYDEWLTVHFQEMFAMSDPDGIWVDGDWPGPCHCPRCESRFREESGYDGPMPAPRDLSTEAGVAWSRTWAGIMYEWRGKLSALIKGLKPTCMYSSGNVSPRKEFSTFFDWKSGDWFSPNNHRLQQTIICRRYTTGDVPYDAMTCDTCFVHSRHHLRARSKTLSRMLQEGAGILANGGQWCYWTYPMPNGAFIPSKMKKAVAAKEFAQARKDVYLHNESLGWTAILDTQPTASRPTANVWGAGKALIELHRSPDVIDEGNLSDDMTYDLMVVPEQYVLDVETVDKLMRFVRRGGKLLSTGASITAPEMQELLGIRLVKRGVVNDGHVFLENEDPAGVYAPWDKVELVEAEELYPLYLSWDHWNPEMRIVPPNYPINGMVDEENPDPAGYPGATVRKLGQGVAVHVPTAFFSTYWTYGNPDMRAWMGALLERLQPDPLFSTDAQCFVEVALRCRGDTLLVHLVNGNPGRDLSHVSTSDLWVDDIPPVGPITFWVRCAQKPESLTWEPGGESAEASWKKGVLEVVLPRLEIHTCLVAKGWER